MKYRVDFEIFVPYRKTLIVEAASVDGAFRYAEENMDACEDELGDSGWKPRWNDRDMLSVSSIRREE